jgi:hypothetical protein
MFDVKRATEASQKMDFAEIPAASPTVHVEARRVPSGNASICIIKTLQAASRIARLLNTQQEISRRSENCRHHVFLAKSTPARHASSCCSRIRAICRRDRSQTSMGIRVYTNRCQRRRATERAREGPIWKEFAKESDRIVEIEIKDC